MTAEWLKPRLEGSSGRRLELMSGANLARSKVLWIVLGATAGLLGGFAVIVRPVGILYFAPMSIYLLLVLRRRAWRQILVFVPCFLLVPLLWAGRNFVETGYLALAQLVPLTYWATAPPALWRPDVQSAL